MDIYGVLKQEHEQVKSLLQTLSKTGEGAVKTREGNFEKLKVALTAHSRAEEGVFYRRLAQEEDTRDLVLEGEEEHHAVDRLLEEMQGMEVGDERWTAKLSVLKEQIEHHIDEEEDELFAKARKALAKDESRSLAEDFQRQREQQVARLQGGP